MFAPATIVDFTAEGAANVLRNQSALGFPVFSFCPTDEQLCSKVSRAVQFFFVIRKIAKSSDHLRSDDGVDCVNHPPWQNYG